MIKDPFKALYGMGFEERGAGRKESVSLAFLRRVAEEFVRALTDIPGQWCLSP